MKGTEDKATSRRWRAGGLAGWLLARLGRSGSERAHLALVERISLGPRQQLALIEAEGRRILVATSPEGGPAFYALDERRGTASRGGRVSW